MITDELLKQQKQEALNQMADDFKHIFKISHDLLMKEPICFEGLQIKNQNFSGCYTVVEQRTHCVN